MDLGFIRLYLNDFASAKKGDDPNTVQITKRPFIVQTPCETFMQFSNCKDGVRFVGAIKVELITCDGAVKSNITNFFFYDTLIVDGLHQIRFEFGNTGFDYWTTPLFLKITDLINDNVYYSNSFLITNYRSHLTTRCEYSNFGRFKGIPYDLKPTTQTIRFFDCFYQDSANTKNIKSYTQTDGNIANYRDVTTFGKMYVFSFLDIAIDNRLNEMFSHDTVFVDGERIKIQTYEPAEILGDTNFKTATFSVNTQGQYSTLGYQLFEPLALLSFTPTGIYTDATFPSDIIGLFNQPVTLGIGTIKIYDEFNNLIITFTQNNITLSDNEFVIDNLGFDTIVKKYYVIISEGLFIGLGCNNFSIRNITDWTFEIVGGQYDPADYDTTNDYT
jgi:hypothetical protein